MAKQETDIVHTIQMDVSPFGHRLFKNVRGGAYPIAEIKPLIALLFKGKFNAAALMAGSLKPRQFGLSCPGASDLIGYTMVEITPEMVGKRLPLFTVIEAKTEDGTLDREGKQEHFLDVIAQSGGFAGVARSKEDARKIMQIPA